MTQPTTDGLDRAIERLGFRRSFRYGDRELVLACLLREQDWRPLEAPWWQGKEACLIGADLQGNFFLRHCDGSVRYWQHDLQKDVIVAASVREFVRGISD